MKWCQTCMRPKEDRAYHPVAPMFGRYCDLVLVERGPDGTTVESDGDDVQRTRVNDRRWMHVVRARGLVR